MSVGSDPACSSTRGGCWTVETVPSSRGMTEGDIDSAGQCDSTIAAVSRTRRSPVVCSDQTMAQETTIGGAQKT